MSKLIRKACGIMLAATLVLSSAIMPQTASHAASVTTPKDIKGHWAQTYIEKAITAGIVAGYKDGRFRPENPVSRAEFAHMINSVLGNTSTATLNFKDVKKSDWYYSDISKAIAAGYASGYSDNTFGPNRYITRQEAAIMLSMVIPSYGSSKSLTAYPDYNKIASWARPAMERMVGKAYINVYTSDKKLHPTDKMTRAQAATVIVNVMEKEKIVKTQTSLSANGSQLSNAIYSNGVSVSKASGNGNAELSKCVVLGTLSITDGSSITLTNSRVSQATIQSGTNVSVTAKGETYVKNAAVANTASLASSSLTGGDSYGPGFVNISVVKSAQVSLNGAFPQVTLDGSSSDVTLTSGKIENLVVPTGGNGCDFTAESGSNVTLITAASPVYLHGTGTVAKLAANAGGITYEKKPSAITLGSGVKAPTQSDARTTVRSNPTNGQTGVAVDSKITLNFNSPMKLYNGDSIGKSDIRDFTEVRRLSPTGPKISFSASIDSANKVITITPDDDLIKNSSYHIIIKKDELKDANGKSNSAFSSSFNTGNSGGGDNSVSNYMSFTPKDGAKNVDTSVNPKIVFSEELLTYDGTSIKNGDLNDIIVFREDGSSGRNVKFSASISSDKETITIEPDSKLDTDSKYYLAIDSKTLKTASKGTVVPAASVTWSTGDGSSDSGQDSDYISFTPKSSKKDIAINVEPEIRFSEKMECYDGSSITSKDLTNDIIIFREKNSEGRDVNFSASIDSAKRVVTITPSDDLKVDTKYYLAVASKSIRTVKNSDKVAGASVTWTTGSKNSSSSSNYVTFYPRDGKKSISRDMEATIEFSERVEYYGGSKIDSGKSRDLDDCITFTDEDGRSVDFRASYNTSSYTITIVPDNRLSSDTKYTLGIKRRSFQTRADEETIPNLSVSWTTK